MEISFVRDKRMREEREWSCVWYFVVLGLLRGLGFEVELFGVVK